MPPNPQNLAPPFKPGERRVGRKKGTPNKVNAQPKDMVLQALSKAGGVDYLVRQAQRNPGPFLVLVGKVLPLQMTGEGGGPIATTTTVIHQHLGEGQ